MIGILEMDNNNCTCVNCSSFLMIVATDHYTNVDVYYAHNGVTIEDEHLTLQKYEVFTRDTSLLDGDTAIDFTGTHVVATKPISVYSGNGRAYLHPEVSNNMKRVKLRFTN